MNVTEHQQELLDSIAGQRDLTGDEQVMDRLLLSYSAHFPDALFHPSDVEEP